jgi:hypothetical protein
VRGDGSWWCVHTLSTGHEMCAGLWSNICRPSGAVSKAGVWAMCDSIRLELRHLGVGVGSAHPTFFRTPLMDDIVADPAGHELWGGTEKGLWKMVPLQTVIDGLVRGIEQRAAQIIIPKPSRPPPRLPACFVPSLSGLASVPVQFSARYSSHRLRGGKITEQFHVTNQPRQALIELQWFIQLEATSALRNGST